MLDDDIRRTMGRIEAKLDRLLSDAGLEVDGPVCAHCGSTNVIADTCFGESERWVCGACGKVTISEQEAVHG